MIKIIKKNLKKIVFLISMMLGAKIFAGESITSGVYVGLGGGYNKIGSRMSDITAQELGDAPFTIAGQRQDLSTLSLTGFLGYLHFFKESPFTLGGEFFWTFHKGDQSFQKTQTDQNGNNFIFDINSKLRQKYEYGFKILPGYLITQSDHVYGIMGISNKNFNEVHTLKSLDFGGGAPLPSLSNSINRNFSKNYFILGIGYERAANRLKYGIEGFYQLGNKKAGLDNRLFLPLIDRTIVTSATRKIENSYTLLFKVSYNFNVLG